MTDELELIGGAAVDCTDGPCGTLGRLIVDPTEHRVTHLSVEPTGLLGSGRLVPIDQVQSAGDPIQLQCQRSDFDAFAPNEASQLLPPEGAPAAIGVAWVTLHEIPEGEVEVNGDENILAVDGRVGHLRGLTVDRASSRIADVLLEVGHLLGRRKISIPAAQITAIDDDGIHLVLTRSEVGESPEIS